MALSSSISHSLKTFCVIPHLVRDDEAFEAVHEDYIVYDASGKILNFDFSAVLSPAHNLSHNILAPLFHVIRDRRQDAALLVACPGSSGEASTVALDLFANMLPLLFRAVPNAPIAHISVVEVQRDGKTLTDLYRMTKVHALHELDTEEVLRASANEAWGGVMELVAQRGSWTNDGESGVLVLIRLEGYATLIVGDIGSSAEILSHVNLTLRSSDIFERSGRTIAPRVPIARLLQPCATQYGSIVHVVLVPDPMTSPKQTLRLLHFGSNLMKDITLADTTPAAQNFPQRQPASQPTTTNHSHFENEYDVTTSSSVSLGAAAATSSTRREDFSSISFNGGGGASMTPSSTRRKPAAGRVPSPAATAGGGRKPAPLTQEAQHQSWRDEIVHGLLAASSSSASGGGGVPDSRQQQQQQHYGGVGGHYDGSSSMLVITPSQREQQFAQKVTTLDKIAKDQKQKILALQNELKRTQGELNDAKHEADTCRTEAAELKSDAEHARKEQKDAAELVATLLKRISGMEQITSSGNNEATDLRRRNDDLVAAARKLEEQLSHATHKLRSLEKKEVLRLRESTLDRITAPVSSSSPMRGHAPANTKRNHNNTAKTSNRDSEANARKTRNADDSVHGEDHHNNEDDSTVTWDQNSLLHSIKQMRDRCAKLESENHDLRLKHQQEEAFRHAVSLMEGGGAHHDHGDMVTSPPQSHNHKRQHEKDLHHQQAGGGGGGGGTTPPKSRRSALDELHKRMTQRDITDEEDEASSPPTSPLHHGSQQQQHRVVSQYLEKERALLKKQVQQFTDEISRVQKDKDELQQLLALHPSRLRQPTTTALSSGEGDVRNETLQVAEVVHSVAHSMTSGCQSLIVQLQVILSSDAVAAAAPARSQGQPSYSNSYAAAQQGMKKNVGNNNIGVLIDSQTRILITQHTQALSGIKQAVDDIVSRRSSMAAIPSTASATDCEALSHLLTFEVERLTHLRAFIPTFGQLCVAVEHIKMRCHHNALQRRESTTTPKSAPLR